MIHSIKCPIRRALLSAALLALISVTPAHATITFYTTRAAFNTAAPGLPVDHFGSTLSYQPYPLDYYFHTRPVDSTTNDSIFPSGSILPGLSITTAQPVFESQAIKVEPISGGNQVGTGTFEDTLILNFSPAVQAVGFDLSGHVYSHPYFNGTVELKVYYGASQLVSTVLPVNQLTFVGFTSTAVNITRVTLLFAYDADANTFVANVAFGTPVLRGDFNCDGAINAQDVAAAVLRLIDPAAYAAQYPNCAAANSDVNADGSVDGLDVQAFVTLLLDN